MLTCWSNSWRAAPRGAVVLLACIAVATPIEASALARAKARSPQPAEEIVTPQRAAESRGDAQEAAKALRQIGDPVAAGMRLDEAAAQWGDPILYMDAAEAWLDAAKKDGSPEYVDAAIERVHIAVDILYFHLDASADKNFRMVETGELPALIERADDLVDQGERVRAEIDGGPAVEAVTDDAPKKKNKRRNRKADKAMFIGGAGLTALGGALMVMGAAGLVVGAVKQNQAERPDVLGQDYDAVAAQGHRGNVMAGAGFGVGGAAVIAGVTLMLVAKRKGNGKRRRAEEDDRMVRVSPSGSRSGGGVVLSGRF